MGLSVSFEAASGFGVEVDVSFSGSESESSSQETSSSIGADAVVPCYFMSDKTTKKVFLPFNISRLRCSSVSMTCLKK